jgi:hypothetical protein
MTSSVALVLDRHFGTQIDELAQQMPVWTVASTENHDAVVLARSRLDSATITEFFATDGEDLRSMCSRVLYDIDEHHGPASATRPYEELFVYGGEKALLAPDVARELGLEETGSVRGALRYRKHIQQRA